MKKLSLVMSGAVSLGSFQSGVLTELLYALDHQWGRGDDFRYQLDVITGASAGAMTAGLVAYATMNHFDRRSNIRRAWVDLVSIDRLMQNPPEHSFLSQEPIEAIASESIAPPFTTNNKARFAPEVLRVGLTLANLNGLNRRLLSQISDASFVSTFFDDRKLYRLAESGAPGTDDVRDPMTWDSVRRFAIASGAFPLAFAPLELLRSITEYDGLLLDSQTPFRGKFSYVDGGTFNNQPIGESVGLAREADRNGPTPERRYLFVNANADNSTYDPRFGDPPEELTFVSTAQRVAEVIFNQSRTSDWIRSLLINDQVQWRDDFFEALADLIARTTVEDPAAFSSQLEAVARPVIEGKSQHLEVLAPEGTFERELEATMRRHQASLLRIGEGETTLATPRNTRRYILALIFLTLDNIANLNNAKKIDISVISVPLGEKLAGQQLQAFGGFFKHEWREYNYRRGRIVAHAELRRFFNDDYPKEPGSESDYEIPAEWQRFPDESIESTDRRLREQFRDLVVERAQRLADDFRPTGFSLADSALRQPIRFAIGRLAARKLDDRLGL